MDTTIWTTSFVFLRMVDNYERFQSALMSSSNLQYIVDLMFLILVVGKLQYIYRDREQLSG
jgi:hypothetical protein